MPSKKTYEFGSFKNTATISVLQQKFEIMEAFAESGLSTNYLLNFKEPKYYCPYKLQSMHVEIY